MSLRILLLGLIEISPMPGYDLAKVFDGSMLFYWHATQTQIYNTLKEMESEGLVTGEVIHQTKTPSKKIFSITEQGKQAIADWLLEEPKLPGFKHDFLIKLSFASRLSDAEILAQLDMYEAKLREKLTGLQSDRRQEFLTFSKHQKELALWKLVFENGLMHYQSELAWVEKVRQLIKHPVSEQDGTLGTDLLATTR